MSDLVQKLRLKSYTPIEDVEDMIEQAADRIEALEAQKTPEGIELYIRYLTGRIEALEAALREMADYKRSKPTIEELETLLAKEDDEPVYINPDGSVSKDVQAIARRALEGKP